MTGVPSAFLFAFVPFLVVFALGVAVGWHAGAGRPRTALAVLLAGGFLVLLGYVGLMSSVFSLQNTIR